MKRIATLLCTLFTLSCFANVDIFVKLTDFTISPSTNRTVYVQALTAPTTGGSSTVIGSRLTYTTDASGQFYVSNALNNVLYNFDVQAPPSRTTFMVLVSSNDTGVVSAWSNMTASSTATFPAGLVAWSAASSDLRYARLPISGTNLLVAAGANMTFTTNTTTGVVTYSSTGGQGGFTGNANQFELNAGLEEQIKSGALLTNQVLQGTTRIGAGIVTNAGTGTTIVNLGLDSSGNIVTNATPVGSSATFNANQFGVGGGTNIKSGSLQTNNFFLGVPEALDGLLIVSNQQVAGSSGQLIISGNTGQGGFGDVLKSDPSVFSITPGGSSRPVRVPQLLVTGTGTSAVVGDVSGATNYNATNLDVGTRTIYITTDVLDPTLIIGTNATPGWSYILAPGIYNCTNWCKIPTNGSIVGYGATLINYMQPSRPTPLIGLSDNSLLAGVTITNFFGENGVGSCIGTHQFDSTASGGVVTSGLGGYTNFVGRDLTLWGGSDTYYNRQTNGCKGELWNSKLYGGWDILTAFNIGTQYYDFHYCQFVHRGQFEHGNASDIAVASANSTCLVRFYNCDFYFSNSVASVSYLWNSQDPQSQSVEFYGCTFTNASGTTRTFPLITSAQNGLTPKIVNCNFPANIVGVDEFQGLETRYDPTVTTNITFGGDTANGLGPQIFRSGSASAYALNHTAGSNWIANVEVIGKELVIRSNTLANLVTLAPGSMAFWMSNGTPYLIASAIDGTLTTNQLAAGSGTVTSVGFSTTTGLTASGGPITTSGTLQLLSPSEVLTNGHGIPVILNGTLTVTNGDIVRSNSWLDSASLIKGDIKLVSSNGAPYVIAVDSAGNRTTNPIVNTPGTDGSAWHNTGDNYTGANAVFLGPTNYTDFQIRMQENGNAGATIAEFGTLVGNDAVNIKMGASNSIGSANFGTVLIGTHQSSGNGPTWASVLGGGFNSVGPNGNQATVVGGATNAADGAYSFAAGQAAWARNDNSFVWNGIPNLRLATSGSGGDNGRAMFGTSNAGFWVTNGNDASINGIFAIFGRSFWSSNTAVVRGATIQQTNSGNFSVLYMGTNPPAAGHENSFGSGVISSNWYFVLESPGHTRDLAVNTNGGVELGQYLTVTGSGSNYFGANVNVNGTVNATGITNSGLTSANVVATDSNGKMIAATAAGLNTAIGGEVLTNGHTHDFSIVANTAFVKSNYMAYAVARGYAALTNLVVAGTPNLTNAVSILLTNASFTWGQPINPDANATYPSCVTLVSNSAASAITLTLPAGWVYTVGSTNGVNAGGITRQTWERVLGLTSNVTSVQIK